MRLRITFMMFTLATLLACQSESEDPGVDCSASTLTLSLVNVVDANCDLNNGAVAVSASGGSGNFTYSISGGSQNSSGEFTGLSAGSYTVSVSDGDCSADINVTVNNEGGVVISSVMASDSGCGTMNGTVTVTATEGAPPYTYALDNGTFQDENVFNGLAQGTYTVRVSDQNDCEITQEVAVLSGISWTDEVSGIIENNCALPSCHGGAQNPDFREFINVQSNAQNIKNRTQNGTMPPTGALPAAQVEAIACWVDDGAPEN